MKSIQLAALFICLLFGSLQIPQLYFTVAGEEGDVAWRVEAPAIGALRRMGILRSLRIGQIYEVDYFPSRDGSPIALMGAITDSEGRRFGGDRPPGAY